MIVASLDDLVAGYEKRRLVRRGVPIKTDTYVVGDALIWGATARILGLLLERLGRFPDDAPPPAPLGADVRRDRSSQATRSSMTLSCSGSLRISW